jgi:TPR repeat protein/serine/threonine protein kinase
VPARVGRYEVRAVLGEGAFGRVYHAFDPQLHRDVAVKVPHPGALTPGLRERFLREARATATVHHPNVCPIHDVGTDGDLPYLVMHFIPGGTLAGLLTRRPAPFPPASAAAVVRKLALGVAAAHAKGVLHRDLKPANVLWDAASREVLVTDFGLARVGGEAPLSRTGDILGTPAYMSPEQGRGRPEEVGPLTDVYSLGVILYRLLAGAVPFQGSVMEVLAQAQFNDPAPPSAVRPGLDPAIDTICLKAMARKPADRYASANEFVGALADYLRGQPTPSDDGGEGEVWQGFVEAVEPGAAAAETVPPRSTARTAAPGSPDPGSTVPPPPRAAGWREDSRETRGSRKPLLATVGVVLLALVAGGIWLAFFRDKPAPSPDGGVAASSDGGSPSPPHPDGPDPTSPTAKPPEPKAIVPKPPAPPPAAVTPADVQRDWDDYKRARLTTGKFTVTAERGPKRLRAWKQAAEAGSPAGMVLYGECLAQGVGVEPNAGEAVVWFRKAANLSEPVAMELLATSYDLGVGVTADEKAAVEWYLKAADRGDPLACTTLAGCYQTGRGVAADEAAAVMWFRKAADQGYVPAVLGLARCYEAGQGVPQDVKAAIDWFRKAADLGDIATALDLADRYETGRGVTADDKEAAGWLRKAADLGNGGAMARLGARYEAGRGVPRDAKAAAGWYRQGAERGDPSAMRCIGVCYENGVGVEKDAREAVRWYRKAADLGDEPAAKRLAELGK